MAKRKLKYDKKRKTTYEFIVAFIKENGYSPTFSEIAQGIGCKSRNHALVLVEQLMEMGLVEYKKGSQRTISVNGYKYIKTDVSAPEV